jgi:hypothetical protein
MSDTNVADTYGGGSHRRLNVRPVPDGVGDPGVIADSDKVVESLSTVLARAQSGAPVNSKTDQPKQVASSPLKDIAARIKKLVHDDGEKFGDELKAIAAIKREGGEISMAKALQLWADETGKDKPDTPEANKDANKTPA